MRPKVVEENFDNFNAVTKDAIERMVKMRDVNGEVPDLEGELSKWSTEGTLYVVIELLEILFSFLMKFVFLCKYIFSYHQQAKHNSKKKDYNNFEF